MTRMENIGMVEEFDHDELFPTRPGWFVAMNRAMAQALTLVEDQHADRHCCGDCPVAKYVEYRDEQPRMAR